MIICYFVRFEWLLRQDELDLSSSRFKRVNAEIVHAFHGRVELDLDEAGWVNSCNFTTLTLSEEFRRRNVLRRWSLNQSKYTRQYWTTHGTEDVHISGMSTWLCWQVGHPVATNYIMTGIITLRERKFELRPAYHIEWSIVDFKWEVPHYSSVCLLLLVCVLAYATFYTLSKILS